MSDKPEQSQLESKTSWSIAAVASNIRLQDS
jgi:hypothetical protein